MARTESNVIPLGTPAPDFRLPDTEGACDRWRMGHPFVYLFDASQETARAYGVACTPDFFVFDGRRRLAYRGRFDASTPGNDVPVTGASLRAAVDAVLAGEPVTVEQLPSMGCNIKGRPGNAPAGG